MHQHPDRAGQFMLSLRPVAVLVFLVPRQVVGPVGRKVAQVTVEENVAVVGLHMRLEAGRLAIRFVTLIALVPLAAVLLLVGVESAQAAHLVAAHVARVLHPLVDAELVLAQALLRWKLSSFSQSQELGQLTNMAFDWLLTLVQPIRSQVKSLT